MVQTPESALMVVVFFLFFFIFVFLLVSLQVVCAEITKAQIETIMSELLQLYDMEAKCT